MFVELGKASANRLYDKLNEFNDAVARRDSFALDNMRFHLHGYPTADHSWFPGFAWRMCCCPDCDNFLGWAFSDVNVVKEHEEKQRKKFEEERAERKKRREENRKQALLEKVNQRMESDRPNVVASEASVSPSNFASVSSQERLQPPTPSFHDAESEPPVETRQQQQQQDEQGDAREIHHDDDPSNQNQVEAAASIDGNNFAIVGDVTFTDSEAPVVSPDSDDDDEFPPQQDATDIPVAFYGLIVTKLREAVLPQDKFDEIVARLRNRSTTMFRIRSRQNANDHTNYHQHHHVNFKIEILKNQFRFDIK